MNRKVFIGILAGLAVLACFLVCVVIHLYNTRVKSESPQQILQVKTYDFNVPDKYAGMEKEAIDIVRQHTVMNPEYIDQVYRDKKTGDDITAEKKRVTIDSLVQNQFFEKRFNMNFLKHNENDWRALHLDTDDGTTQINEPQYEVYLDYHDENVVVGPVWIVDVTTKAVIPRNDMARIFDRNRLNYNEIEENLERSESVVRAITSHKFENGIDLGGVFLLHFLKLTTQPKHAKDQIIGWTVMHDFEDDFLAYFQWKELDEIRVAKFKFNWKTKGLTPIGLYATDLMNIGNQMSKVEAVNIYPNEYTNNLNIPRQERWTKNHACRKRDYKSLCTAFIKVLEQQEFVNAMAWLLTNGEPDANRRVNVCKEQRKCGWSTKLAPKEHNPDNRDDLFEIGYKYEINKKEHVVKFIVNSSDESIQPIDKLSQWAYWSVTPRT